MEAWQENMRDRMKDKKRIVIKIGSSSLTHPNTEKLNLGKLELLVRILCDLHNQGKEVVLVSSGAIAVGRNKIGLREAPKNIPQKQACAAIGQAQLMMIYQKLFSEYNHVTAQVLMTKHTIVRPESRINAQNTFHELLQLGVIPIVNENDTISTYEIKFGDNDRLSAVVTALIQADLLILLSDIDGLYTDDPNQNPQAGFIDIVPKMTKDFFEMGKKSSSSTMGTGGMATKLDAAKIATESGADMIIANGEDLHILPKIMAGEKEGTLFLAHKNDDFYLIDYLSEE